VGQELKDFKHQELIDLWTGRQYFQPGTAKTPAFGYKNDRSSCLAWNSR